MQKNRERVSIVRGRGGSWNTSTAGPRFLSYPGTTHCSPSPGKFNVGTVPAGPYQNSELHTRLAAAIPTPEAGEQTCRVMFFFWSGQLWTFALFQIHTGNFLNFKHYNLTIFSSNPLPDPIPAAVTGTVKPRHTVQA